MTFFGVENLGHYKCENEIPQWMKAERYEYCDQGFAGMQKNTKKHLVFVQMLLSIFC